MHGGRSDRTTRGSDEPGHGIRDALGNRGLARLLVGFGVVNVSELALVTALSIYAFRIGGTLAVGFVGFRLLPGALSSAMLAPLVDRRAGVLTRIAQARVVLFAGMAAGALTGIPLVALLGALALDAIIAAPYRPAQSRLVPSLARTPIEVSATAAGISVVKTLGQAVGALAGGIGAALLAPGSVMAGAGCVMAAAAAATAGLGDRHRDGGRAVFGELRSGLRSIPRVLGGEASPFVVVSALRTLLRGIWSALLVVVALRFLGLGRSGVGVLTAAAGVGAVLALPITASLIGRPRLAGPCAIAFIVSGLALSLVGLIQVTAAAVIAVCAWGVAMALADSTSLALLSRLQDAATLSRTVSVMESLKLGLEGLGALVAPALVALFGVRAAVVAAGAPIPLAIVVGYPRMRRADITAAGRAKVVSLLHRAKVLHSLDMASLEGVAARAHRCEVAAGSTIVAQGEPGDAYYVIESGSAEVVLDGFPIGRLGRQADFGERALLRATPRAATVLALTQMTVYEIGRVSFLSAVTGQPTDAVEDTRHPARQTEPDPLTRPLAHVLADIAFLSELASPDLERLAETATFETWQAGDAIVREGETATAFFVLLSGRARTTINGRPVSELLPGDSFGEIALLHGVQRTATVAAVEPARTCRISADSVRANAAQLIGKSEAAGRPALDLSG